MERASSICSGTSPSQCGARPVAGRRREAELAEDRDAAGDTLVVEGAVRRDGEAVARKLGIGGSKAGVAALRAARSRYPGRDRASRGRRGRGGVTRRGCALIDAKRPGSQQTRWMRASPPSRPARPLIWLNSTSSKGRWYRTTWRTSGGLTPSPALVETTMLSAFAERLLDRGSVGTGETAVVERDALPALPHPAARHARSATVCSRAS